MIAYEQTKAPGNSPAAIVSVSKQNKPQSQPERILILAGTWEMPGCHYGLQILLQLKSDGEADGIIDWNAKYVYGSRESYQDREHVAGSVSAQHVVLKGYDTGPRLYADHYCMDLFGDNSSGSFKGVSETCNRDWSGTMQGTYRFLVQ